MDNGLGYIIDQKINIWFHIGIIIVFLIFVLSRRPLKGLVYSSIILNAYWFLKIFLSLGFSPIIKVLVFIVWPLVNIFFIGFLISRRKRIARISGMV